MVVVGLWGNLQEQLHREKLEFDILQLTLLP
jgi:hypothetical protein